MTAIRKWNALPGSVVHPFAGPALPLRRSRVEDRGPRVTSVRPPGVEMTTLRPTTSVAGGRKVEENGFVEIRFSRDSRRRSALDSVGMSDSDDDERVSSDFASIFALAEIAERGRRPWFS